MHLLNIPTNHGNCDKVKGMQSVKGSQVPASHVWSGQSTGVRGICTKGYLRGKICPLPSQLAKAGKAYWNYCPVLFSWFVFVLWQFVACCILHKWMENFFQNFLSASNNSHNSGYLGCSPLTIASQRQISILALHTLAILPFLLLTTRWVIPKL